MLLMGTEQTSSPLAENSKPMSEDGPVEVEDGRSGRILKPKKELLDKWSDGSNRYPWPGRRVGQDFAH